MSYLVQFIHSHTCNHTRNYCMSIFVSPTSDSPFSSILQKISKVNMKYFMCLSYGLWFKYPDAIVFIIRIWFKPYCFLWFSLFTKYEIMITILDCANKIFNYLLELPFFPNLQVMLEYSQGLLSYRRRDRLIAPSLKLCKYLLIFNT